MNKVILLGNICNDLELKENGEFKTINFNLAVQRKFKNKDGQYESDFIRIVAFNNTATFIKQYFNKGSKIVIEGRIQTRNYDDTNGIKHYVTEVIAENVEFAGSKQEKTYTNIPEGTNVVDSDNSLDLPF